MEMAGDTKEMNQQQNHEIMDEPQQNQRELGESGTSNDLQAIAVETQTIISINYDCLERIFDFLDIQSLLMVANTCKHLQIAAVVKFGDKHVWLNPQVVCRPEVQVYDLNKISVYGLKLCLPFLRCFGGKITNLTVWIGLSKDVYLDQYISQYCADTLENILFQFKSNFSKELFEKPFKNVEKVELFACHLTRDSLSNFAKWFPKMRHLRVRACPIKDTASMDVHFPHLEHLELVMRYYRVDMDHDRNENALDILQSNQSLSSLEINSCFEITLDTLLNKIHGYSTVTKLKVRMLSITIDVNANELERFVAEYPMAVELILESYRFTTNDAINFIHQMKSLKRIEFQLSGRAECDRITTEFEDEWKSKVSTDDGEFYIELNR